MAYNERLENITVGCDDGTSRVFTIQSDNRNSSLEYSKCYPTTGSRILSLAYHPSKPQLFLGCVDGTIRGIDENTGRSIFRLTGNLAKGVQIYITCLIVLQDSTIISGDSKGNVQVWDGSMGVLTLTIHQHAAQILSLAVAPAEDFVFASGVDSRVTCLKRSLNDNNWVYTNSHRCHTHDVYSLAVLFPSSSSDNIAAIPREESYSEDHQTTALYCPLSVASGPLLISGGLDTKLCLYFVEDFLKYRPATILPTPAEGLLLASEDASLMALRHRHRIYLWSVNLAPAEKSLTKKRGPEEESLEGCLLVGELHLKDDNHIAAGAMNSAGTLLTVSSLSGIRMWQLLREKGRESVEIRRVALPDIANAFYHLLQFSPNGETLLAASSTGDIVFLSIQCEGGNESNMVVAVRDVLEHRSLFASSSSLSFGEEDSFVVTHMEMNSDHQWLAVSTVSGHLLIYDLDRLVVHWMLRPSSSSSIACLSFHPNHPQLLAVVTSDNQVSLLDVDTRRKSEKWKFSTTAFENVIRLLTGIILLTH